MSDKFKHNHDGVHVFYGEFTLCGDAFDAPDSEKEVGLRSPFEDTESKTVTCPKCVALIKFCRGIRIAKSPTRKALPWIDAEEGDMS